MTGDYTEYTEKLREHYESFFSARGEEIRWTRGPIDKLHPDFYVLEMGPSGNRDMWTYATIGMSLDRNDNNLIELLTYSPIKDISRAELLSLNASFHRNDAALNLNHTIFVGQLGDNKTNCDHGLVSLPYIEGEELEIFPFKGKEFHCYWYLPITKEEKDYMMQHGCESLEQLFEEKQINYLDLNRKSLV